ncbi:tRNA (cytidine(56)-2'-O)-methyltransferase [Halorubrum ezzemoulense]|uniref:tRNA (cytidine(56)-2'-O)-methyltransferase n=1 Tax=Halorubrum ezzemoulense TaxID=337243 RepID=UPI00232AA2B8|nr:tRNA (cytidine(56)-2'-O)-methyltransferase [Halorubrum ezzemoulense]MDB2240482.1 tRNA (cytidine(56)-2'-O)-methyltransferase [Halorubrum ezzemoulense]MDB9248425.1 tRNA (cytidine(56)-2'-O)-methyltransferase [Halorubrum ezzemoulense]MDB9259237.1 tRNA (cytidine(56)-2'-O)-methyltransferase [Halorubrum ezzemoulense]MDB9262184.1 tRNA (cytidine(56)-2'-O)-methyltransferase [Halorubrum ezzemoulense]MDB9266256.1 tRNA (cytidine(56)-2'-O)-methyltransferase [Halorubrum ezzemoulense]
MNDAREVVVLRYGHRPGRDDRMTTHVGLTARALGADRVIFPDNAGQSAETVRDITGRFGGPFAVELRDDQKAIVREFDGVVVHLTMYGERVQDVEAAVREAVGLDEPEAPEESSPPRDLLVVVGGEKVPWALYERADFNVGVTNQPHSEVAGLAVFLDRLFDGAELGREWADADRRVVPEATGKTVIDAGTETDSAGDDEARDDSPGNDRASERRD